MRAFACVETAVNNFSSTGRLPSVRQPSFLLSVPTDGAVAVLQVGPQDHPPRETDLVPQAVL